jgi:hypothetical protein
MPTFTRRRFLGLTAAAPLALAGCRGLTIFGYQVGAAALYDENISTIYVPVFNNRAFQTNPFRGIEVSITQAVIREIQVKTPYKICSDPSRADTELLGNVVSIYKNPLNRTQQNTLRDAEVVVTVDVVWRDLRDGRILSSPPKPRLPGTPAPADEHPLAFDPTLPPPPPESEKPQIVPARIVAGGRYVMELGETNASAALRVENQIAVQIVSMMEKSWGK